MELSCHWISLTGMSDLDGDTAPSPLVMKSPHIAKNAMCGAPPIDVSAFDVPKSRHIGPTFILASHSGKRRPILYQIG
jgi:hypothetical protein